VRKQQIRSGFFPKYSKLLKFIYQNRQKHKFSFPAEMKVLIL
jgi:hypothetical protein